MATLSTLLGQQSPLEKILTTTTNNPSTIPSSGGFTSNSSTYSTSKGNPVYDLTQTSMGKGMYTAADVRFTQNLRGSQATEDAIARIDGYSTGKGTVDPSVYTPTPTPPNQNTDSLSSVISGELGGYYTQQFPYGSYYGSLYVGGDDDYSGVAYFPLDVQYPIDYSQFVGMRYNDSAIERYAIPQYQSYSSGYVPQYRYGSYRSSGYRPYNRYYRGSSYRYSRYRARRYNYNRWY